MNDFQRHSDGSQDHEEVVYELLIMDLGRDMAYQELEKEKESDWVGLGLLRQLSGLKEGVASRWPRVVGRPTAHKREDAMKYCFREDNRRTTRLGDARDNRRRGEEEPRIQGVDLRI